jgi:MerR family transcriptional regulator, mercuric resistance operon regulatory protein
MNGGALQIGEVARRTALSVDSIRFYERQRLLPAPERSVGRFRLYTSADIVRLQFIREMQGLGFTLREIKQLLDLRTHGVEACSAVHDLVAGKLNEVRAKVKQLRQLETDLERDLRKCKRELSRRKSHTPCTCPVLKVDS